MTKRSHDRPVPDGGQPAAPAIEPDDKVYAIASGKGGVGKTTITTNLATALADLGHTVAVVDADLGMANLAEFFGLDVDGEQPTLHDVLAQDAAVEAAKRELRPGLTVLPSGTDLDAYSATDTAELRTVVARLRQRFDYVLLDIGAGVTYDTVLPLEVVDGVILVTTPDQAALDNVRTTMELIDRAGSRPVGLIVNRRREDDDRTPNEIATDLGVPLLGAIPDSETARAALAAGKPIVNHKPDAPAASAMMTIVARLTTPATGEDGTVPPAPGSAETSVLDLEDGPAVKAETRATAETESAPETEEPTPETEQQTILATEDGETAIESAADPDTTNEEEDDSRGGFLSWLFS